MHAHADNFNSLVDRMITMNPGLKSDYYAREAERESLRSAATLPDPEIEGGYMWSAGEAGNKTDITISQSMEWPGVYGALRREARLRSQAIDASRQVQINDAKETARMLLVDGVYIRKCADVMSRRIACIDSLLEIATKGALRNEITVLDVEKLRIERLEVLSRQSEIDVERARCLSAIGSFVGSSDSAKVILRAIDGYPDEILHPLALYSANSSAMPEIEQSRILAEASRARSDAERRRALPSLTAGYHFAHEDGTPFHGFVAGLSIPVFSSRGKAEAARLESLAEQARAEQQAIEQKASIDALHAEAMNMQQRYESYRKVLEGSSTPRLLLRALDGGQISMMTYLIESASYTDAILRMLEIQYRYQQSMARIARYAPQY
nr:TolC family protein [uncultured Muribaculum sp.]